MDWGGFAGLRNGKGKRKQALSQSSRSSNPISVAQSAFCFHAPIFLPIGFFWKQPAD